MLRFMPENIHAGQAARAAAGKGQKKQRSFLYAPFVFPGPVFIRQHGKEARQIDGKQVDQQDISYDIIHRGSLLAGFYCVCRDNLLSVYHRKPDFTIEKTVPSLDTGATLLYNHYNNYNEAVNI